MQPSDIARNAVMGSPEQANNRPSRQGIVDAFVAVDDQINSLKIENKGIQFYGLSPDNLAAENDEGLLSIASAPKAKYDMLAGVISVSSVPVAPVFENGGWKVAGAAGDAGTVDVVYPARRTFDAVKRQISNGSDLYQIGSQGTAHIVGRGLDREVCAVVHNGPGHYADGMTPHVYRKTLKGARFEDEGAMFDLGPDRNASCFSMGAEGFMRFGIGRSRTGTALDSHDLYYSRAYEQRRDQTVNFTTEAGSADVVCQLEAGQYWDLRVGDLVDITGVGDAVNGVIINGVNGSYSVNSVDSVNRTITITATNFSSIAANVTAGTVERTTVDLVFPKSDWKNILTLDTGTGWTLCHGMQVWDQAGDLRLEFGVHGTAYTGPKIRQVNGLYGVPALSATTQDIGNLAQGIEPDQKRLSGGGKVLTVRASNTGLTTAKIGYSATDDAGDATMYDLTVDAFGGSPVSVVVDEDNDLIIFGISDTRDNAGVNAQAEIPRFQSWQTLSSFKDTGPDIEWWEVDRNFFSNTNGISTSNAVDVGASVLSDGVLYQFYTTESSPIDFDQDGQPRVFCQAMAMGPNGPVGAQLPSGFHMEAASGEAGLIEQNRKIAETQTERLRASILPLMPLAGTQIVGDDDYSAFPVIGSSNGVILAAYHRGRNHTQGDAEAVALSQAAIDSVTINGNEADGGAVSVGAGTEVTVTSTSDNSSINFIITGSLNGVSEIETLVGPNAGSVSTIKKFDTITAVDVSAPVSGTIQVGLVRIACNIQTAVSTNGGATWSNPLELFDGLTDGAKRFYFPEVGVLADGTFYVGCQEIDISTVTYRHVYKTSADGVTWSDLQEMAFTGVLPSRHSFFGKIQTLPDGSLVKTAHLSDKQYFYKSTDGGATWDGVLIYESATVLTSEATISVVSQNTLLVHVRIDAVVATLQQHKSTDGGATWTYQGDLNLPDSSGYDSHDTAFVWINGTRYIALSIMSRDNATAGLNPDSIILKWAKASSLVNDPSSLFGGEVVLKGGLTDLSGYGSKVVDRMTGETVMVYHRENATRSAQIEAIGFNVSELIYGLDEWQVFAPTLTADTGTAPTFNIDSGRFLRQGTWLDFAVDIRVAGAMTYTSALSIDLGDCGAFVFDSPVNNYALVGEVENVKDDTLDVDNISAKAVNEDLTLTLHHQRPNLSASTLSGTEVDDDFRIRVSGRMKVK